jgi:hypothetical protein
MFALYENGKQPRSGINSLFITYCVVCDCLHLMISCQSGMNVERAIYILGALLNLFLFFVLKHVKSQQIQIHTGRVDNASVFDTCRECQCYYRQRPVDLKQT